MGELEDKILRPITSTGSSFYLFIGILLAILGWFSYAYYIQLSQGLGVTGMNEPVYWGLYIASFIFFVGIAHGGISISAAVSVFKLENYRPVARIGELLTIISLMLSGIMITFDLGRPDRVLNLLRYGRWQSPLVWDVIIITIYFMGSVTFMYLGLRKDMPALIKRFPGRGIYKFLAAGYKGTQKEKEVNDRVGYYLGIALLAIMVMASGGVIPLIFGLQVAQPGWFTALLPVYFLCAALSSAIAGVIIIAAIARRIFGWEEFIKEKIFIGLANVLRIFLLFYVYFIVSEQLTIRYAGPHPEQVVSNALFFGEFSTLWWAYLIIFTAVPFFLLVIPQTRNIKGIFIASMLIVPGLWLKRLLIVVPPLTRQLLPTPVIDPVTRSTFLSPATSIGVYSPTWVEWSLFIGVLSLGALLFTLFSKFFPLIELDVGETLEMERESAQADVPSPETKASSAEAPSAGEAKEPAKCDLCGAEFSTMDECCEHAETEHQITKASCDMACVPAGAETEVEASKGSECELCGATFGTLDECCEHAEKEHQISKSSCDMACKEG
ncbi:MAG: NrfD/PsrC family molybdoenzyme membrane anchor subunit [Candidatus Hydrothermarchaeaceae archaeon]